MRVKAFKDVLSLFQLSFAPCIHLGKSDSSFDFEYCFISHKSVDRGKNLSEKYIRNFDIFS